MPCSCFHPGQDALYGQGLRVFNETAKRRGEQPVYRCTVCTREKTKGEK